MEISGQKIDITYIRKKLLEKNEKFMWKRSDEVFDKMDRESIIENLQKLNEVQSGDLNLETNDLRNKLKSLERTRHLVCWHDGSTIGGHGYIAITISVMFDVAAFFSDEKNTSWNMEKIYAHNQLLRSRIFT